MATLAETRKETSGDAFFFYFEGPIVALFLQNDFVPFFGVLNNKTIRQLRITKESLLLTVFGGDF